MSYKASNMTMTETLTWTTNWSKKRATKNLQLKVSKFLDRQEILMIEKLWNFK